MTLLRLVFESALVGPMVALGLAIAVAPLALAMLLSRSRRMRLARLIELVREGNATEARVLARSGGGLRPMLEALGGAAAPPKSPPIIGSVILALVALIPVAAVPMYGLWAIDGAAPAEVIGAVSAITAGTAMIAPVAVISAAAIVQIGLRSSRAVRGACVAVLLSSKPLKEPRLAKSSDDLRATGEQVRVRLREEAK